MYKITFNMTSPIAIIDDITLDAIISYCVYQKFRKEYDVRTASGSEVDPNKQDIPIKKHESGFYLSSYLFLDGEMESVDRWRKRWESRYDHLVDFGKAKRRIHTGSGQYKSYDMPILIKSTKKIFAYFESDNVGSVDDLINNYLIGIGKKVKIGYGWFSSFMIEKIDNTNDIFNNWRFSKSFGLG